MADTKRFLPSCRSAASSSYAYYGIVYTWSTMQHLEPCRDFRQNFRLFLITILLLSWCCCAKSFVSETYVDPQLTANMQLEVFPRNVAASNHGVPHQLRPSITKRNSCHKCIPPARVTRFDNTANAHVCAKSSYRREYPHLHRFAM